MSDPSAPAMPAAAPAARAVSDSALWFGLFGAPAVWALQMVIDAALVSHSCYPKSEPLATPMGGWLWGVVLLSGIVAAVIAAGAGATAWRSWRRTREEHHGRDETLLEVGEGRTRFMAVAGMLLSTVFLFGIIMNALPLFLVPPCG
jgi:hypothetical protein